METQLSFLLHTYMLVVSMVVFHLQLVQSCSSDVGYSSDPNTLLSFPCSRKYLSESYFEKHDSLLDSDFQDFLANEVPLCSCNVMPHSMNYVIRLSVLRRHLFGEGSHRHLSTFLKFSIKPEPTPELTSHLCQVMVVERLPSGVFADPFELQHLVQRGVFIDAAVFGDTNLELPSALSNRSAVEIHMDIGENILLGNRREVDLNIELPLHARYPPLNRSGYSTVEMGMPDIILRCTSKDSSSQHRNCSRMTLAETADFNISAVPWRIPCGNDTHSGVVSAVTFISALLSSLLIIVFAVCSPKVHWTEPSKQS